MAGYIPYRSVGGTTTGEMRNFLLKNSETSTLGDAVKVLSGYAEIAGAGARVMGVVVGFFQQKADGSRIALGSSAAALTNAVRSGNQGIIGSDTVVAASDNVTVDKVGVRVVVDPNMEYVNTGDEVGTTLGVTHVGTYFDSLSTGDQIDTSTTTVTGTWLLMEFNPLGDAVAGKGAFKLVESALLPLSA